MSDEPIMFLASLPPTNNAIAIHGDGGARAMLDIPDSEMPAIIRLALMRGHVLRVTVELEIQENSNDEREPTKTQDRARATKRPTRLASG